MNAFRRRPARTASPATVQTTAPSPTHRPGPPPPSAPGPWQDGLGRAATRSAQALLVLALAACLVWGLTQVKLLVIPVLIAAILAAALSPLVRLFRRWGWPRALATWAALLAGLGTLGVVLWLVGRGIRDEWPTLVEEAGRGLTELERYLTQGPLGITEEQIATARDSLTEALSSDQVQSGAITGATAAAEGVAGLLLGVVVLFFLMKDGRAIFGFLIRPLSPERQERAWRVGNRSVGVLGGYVRGTAVVALVDAVVIGLALVLLKVPLALPLATIVFLGAFIPLIGATVAGVLATLVALVTNGPTTALIVLAVVILVNQLEGDLLAPVVIGKALSLHPLAILLALTAGTILSGIIGALLAVPITAVAWAAITQWKAPEDADVDADRPPRRLPARRTST